MKNPFLKLYNAVRRLYLVKTMPLRLEFVLTDSCNLNCRGCTHYSPLAPREFEPLGRLRSNMRHLSEVCGRALKSVYLIGGEPLLYPELTEAMEAARRHFPAQDIYLFTNGLALSRMSEEFWQTASRLGIVIALTRYPVAFDYDNVEAMCAARGVRVNVFEDRSKKDSFFRFALDPEGRCNPKISHFKCYNRGCMTVLGERLYPCSISACVGYLNRAKGTRFRHSEGDSRMVATLTDVSEVRALRDKPVPFCRHCRYPVERVPYGPSRRDVTEWVDTTDRQQQ